MPAAGQVARALPAQPALEATPESVAAGRKLYNTACKSCHGEDAVARKSGSPGDLRYADVETHARWHGIVIGGALRTSGMPAFDISVDESELIRLYVLSRAEALRQEATR